ncbi:MAG: uracil-DNA glycosylase [Christensenellales bacterium]
MSLAQINKHHAALVRLDPLAGDGVLVPGEGESRSPRLMLIGEAPGGQESLQGRPFVGKAGHNLDGFLQTLGLSRESIYITNLVKLRPTKASAQGRLSNRPPNRAEKQLFMPWLMAEVAQVAPRLLVTLGNTPLRAFLGEGATVGECHGRLAQTAQGLMIFPLYHPAAIIYDRALQPVYQEDLCRLKGVLDEM